MKRKQFYSQGQGMLPASSEKGSSQSPRDCQFRDHSMETGQQMTGTRTGPPVTMESVYDRLGPPPPYTPSSGYDRQQSEPASVVSGTSQDVDGAGSHCPLDPLTTSCPVNRHASDVPQDLRVAHSWLQSLSPDADMPPSVADFPHYRSQCGAGYQTDEVRRDLPMDPCPIEVKQEKRSSGSATALDLSQVMKTGAGRVSLSNMSLWAKTQTLGPDALRQVQNAYNIGFPIEVRHYFAAWIEEQPWREINEDQPAHEVYATQLLDTLIDLIRTKAKEDATDFLNRVKFQEIAKQFGDMYSGNPMSLVRVVKTCLDTEERLVNQSEQPQAGMDVIQTDNGLNEDIQRQIDFLRSRTQQTEYDLKEMQQKQEKFVIDYQSQLKLSNTISQAQAQNTQQARELERKLVAEKEALDRQLLSAAQEILKLRLELAAKHMETIIGLEALQKKVVDEELINWKRKQQMAGNGATFDSNMIETLQRWCEFLAESIWENRKQVIKVDYLRQGLPIDVPQGHRDVQPELNQRVTGLLSTLVTSTFIVETQPPQVLKRDARFTATVRLLVGGKLNIHMSPPEVKATILSEAQARGLLQNDTNAKEQSSGHILNNVGTMEYHQATGQLMITFRNMQLKKIVRADRRGSETVAEEKFCVLFQSDFNVGGNELVFQVWTLSLPVVVTVHGNQECNALATVLWDNQFSEPGRTPFQVPDKVKWPDLANMLSTKFQAMTGRGLSDSNLSYLASKIFGVIVNDYSGHEVTWQQFNKESTPGRNFTFWEWFYAIMKLTRDHLRSPWNDGSIIGFISKTVSQEYLMEKPNGTFLLRFSESEVGGITIAWVTQTEDPQKPGDRQVWNLAPFTTRDFSIRSLADRIKDLHSLVTLFPATPKDVAFGKYYSVVTDQTPNLSPSGYIRAQLRNVIPQMPPPVAGVMSFDNPQTPQAVPYTGPSSPASTYSSAMTPQGDASTMETIDDVEEVERLLAMDYTADDHINVNELFERLLSNQPSPAANNFQMMSGN